MPPSQRGKLSPRERSHLPEADQLLTHTSPRSMVLCATPLTGLALLYDRLDNCYWPFPPIAPRQAGPNYTGDGQ